MKFQTYKFSQIYIGNNVLVKKKREQQIVTQTKNVSHLKGPAGKMIMKEERTIHSSTFEIWFDDHAIMPLCRACRETRASLFAGMCCAQ